MHIWYAHFDIPLWLIACSTHFQEISATSLIRLGNSSLSERTWDLSGNFEGLWKRLGQGDRTTKRILGTSLIYHFCSLLKYFLQRNLMCMISMRPHSWRMSFVWRTTLAIWYLAQRLGKSLQASITFQFPLPLMPFQDTMEASRPFKKISKWLNILQLGAPSSKLLVHRSPWTFQDTLLMVCL